jgi:hypothetical protein
MKALIVCKTKTFLCLIEMLYEQEKRQTTCQLKTSCYVNFFQKKLLDE